LGLKRTLNIMVASSSLWAGVFAIGAAESRPPESTSSSLGVPIEILEPPQRQVPLRKFPVQTGLVFRKNELISENHGRLVNEKGISVPNERKVMQYWQDGSGSIRWLLLRFKADAGEKYFFRLPPNQDAEADDGAEPVPVVSTPDRPLGCLENNQIVVDTGSLRIEIPVNSATWDLAVFVGKDRRILSGGGPVLETTEGLTVGGPYSATLEENGPLQATVRIRGFQRSSKGRSVAEIDLRLVCYKDESFLRVYHTMTWMVRSPEIGIRELAFRLNLPSLGKENFLVGVGNSPEISDTLTLGTTLRVAQSSPTEFSVFKNGVKIPKEGQLNGSASIETGTDRELAVSLRDLWQMYPAGFTFAPGVLQVDFWAAGVAGGTFSYKDVIPEPIYSHPDWLRYAWSKEAGHAVSEWETNPYWAHTAEGAARTHEFTIFVHEPASLRTAAEIHDLTQNPPAPRQDPAWAMRVPVLGFTIPSTGSVGHEDIERAIETIGRMSISRWVDGGNYGFWRFGMQRWGGPTATDGLYRWFDGVQYDQQMIPLLLFMRGGDRSFLLEAERTSRFGMDVATNHYNTRNVEAGYQAGGSCLPFPWLPLHLHKHIKIHFLQYYYHLTGDLRTRDVMDTVIKGALWAGNNNVRPEGDPHRHGNARELFAGNLLWPAIWEETGSEEARKFSDEWANLTVDREFDAESGVFASPRVHAVTGSVYQDVVFGRPKMAAALLQYLKTVGFPDLAYGGITDPPESIACPWAFEKTGDSNYLARHATLAQIIADTVPVLTHPLEQTEIGITGNALFRNYLFPMLTGLESMRLLEAGAPLPIGRLILASALNPSDRLSFVVRVSPGQPIKIRALVLSENLSMPELRLQRPVEFRIKDDAGRLLQTMILDTQTPSQPGHELIFCDTATITPPGGQLKIEVKGTEPRTLAGIDTTLPQALLLENKPVAMMGLGGQDGPGVRLYLKTKQGPLAIRNLHNTPYTIRDAKTGEELFHSTLPVPGEESHQFGAERILAFTFGAKASYFHFSGGIEPLLTSSAEWFETSD